LPAHAGPAGRGCAVVADEPAGEGGEDRREGDLARPLPRLPDGGGGGAARAVRAHPRPDRKATSTRARPMLTLARGSRGQWKAAGVELGPACVLGVSPSRRKALGDVPDPRGGCHDGRKHLPARSQGGTQAQGRGWSPSIWAMSDKRSGRAFSHPGECRNPRVYAARPLPWGGCSMPFFLLPPPIALP